MSERQRQRMWWEAATRVLAGMVSDKSRVYALETFLCGAGVGHPELNARRDGIMAKQAGKYADTLLAEYDRRFATPHPAPAAATGEGMRWFRHTVPDVSRPYVRVTPDGRVFYVEDGEESTNIRGMSMVEDLVRRNMWVECDRDGNDLAPTEAAALPTPRKPEAEGEGEADAPPCPHCGLKSCYHCPECGWLVQLGHAGHCSLDPDKPKPTPTPPAPGLREAAEQAARRLVCEMTWGWPESEGMEELTPDQERHVTALANAFVDFAALAATPAQTAGVPEEVRKAMADLALPLSLYPSHGGDAAGVLDATGQLFHNNKQWRAVATLCNYLYRISLTPTTTPAGPPAQTAGVPEELAKAIAELPETLAEELQARHMPYSASRIRTILRLRPALTPTTAPAGEVAGGE